MGVDGYATSEIAGKILITKFPKFLEETKKEKEEREKKRKKWKKRRKRRGSFETRREEEWKVSTVSSENIFCGQGETLLPVLGDSKPGLAK